MASVDLLEDGRFFFLHALLGDEQRVIAITGADAGAD